MFDANENHCEHQATASLFASDLSPDNDIKKR
jgi:hypothetical protein